MLQLNDLADRRQNQSEDGFLFGDEKLSKPGKCPECRGTRIFEAQVRIE